MKRFLSIMKRWLSETRRSLPNMQRFPPKMRRRLSKMKAFISNMKWFLPPWNCKSFEIAELSKDNLICEKDFDNACGQFAAVQRASRFDESEDYGCRPRSGSL